MTKKKNSRKISTKWSRKKWNSPTSSTKIPKGSSSWSRKKKKKDPRKKLNRKHHSARGQKKKKSPAKLQKLKTFIQKKNHDHITLSNYLLIRQYLSAPLSSLLRNTLFPPPQQGWPDWPN